MGKRILLSFLFLLLATYLRGQDSLRFSGQLSSWVNANTESPLPLWGGARYIPQLNYRTTEHARGHFDGELSANISGSAGLHPFDSLHTVGNLKSYRGWIRYSTHQLELRLGLQKLNFGSAAMLRPLMWFDQLDSRDPLQLTDGVWGMLARYYFLDNSNIWLWGLYGNHERRGWEVIPVNPNIPEFGGRVQLPIPAGEAALSFHHRVADSRDLGVNIPAYERIPENRIGLDAKWDLQAGLWLEGSYTHMDRDVGMLTNQLVMNAGIDYTFATGNGIYAAFEQLMATYDAKPFAFTNQASFSLMTVSYPIGLFDKLSAMVYYGWDGDTVYSFLNWQRQYDRIVLHAMAFWNPESVALPAQSGLSNLFAGKGIQLMIVFNH